MHEMTIEERSMQAQETMLHPLLPWPVFLDLEKESMAILLDQRFIHKGLFCLQEPSLEKRLEFSKKILQIEQSLEVSPFSMILVESLKNLSQPEGGFSFKEVLEGDLKDSAEERMEGKEKAREIMAKYAIDEWDESIQEPKSSRRKTETREKFRLIIENKEFRDTLLGNKTMIHSFTPSFQEGMGGREKEFREMVYALVKGVQILKGKAKIGLHLQLRPEQFGQMEIELIMDEAKNIQIKFVLFDQMAQSFITSNLNLLKKNLLEAGIDVKGIEVELKDDSDRVYPDLDGFHIRQKTVQDLAGRINYVA